MVASTAAPRGRASTGYPANDPSAVDGSGWLIPVRCAPAAVSAWPASSVTVAGHPGSTLNQASAVTASVTPLAHASAAGRYRTARSPVISATDAAAVATRPTSRTRPPFGAITSSQAV